jgi:hypothetical protein
MWAQLNLANRYHRPLATIPFTYGVPIPSGLVRAPADIGLLDAAEQSVPVAVQPMATWPDGSIRWALLDFAGDFGPSEKSVWRLALAEGIRPPAPEPPVRAEQTEEGIRVSNGRLVATFRRARFSLIESLAADGVEFFGPGCRNDIVAVSPAGKIFRASYDPAPRLSLEDASALRTVVRWDGGLFAGDGTRLTEFRLKLHFYAGNPYVKVEHSTVCREPPERGVFLREYRIDLETRMDARTTKVVRQKNHGVDYLSRLVELTQNVRIKVPTKTEGATVPGWPVGVLGTAGKPLLEDESAFGENAGEYPHFLRPGAPRVALGGGYAVVFPYLGVRDSRRTLVGSFLRMAPQYPKGLSADENRFSFEVWPLGSGEWRISRGMTKTHHLAWSFLGQSLEAEAIDNEAIRREYFAAELHDPVTITLDPEYARQAGEVEADRVLPSLPARYPKLESKIAGIQLHGQPLAYSGMMDYGEAISTNNEEDQGYEYAMEYFRSGSYLDYQKFVAQMLHNSTVDVVAWDPDPLREGGTPYHTDYHQDAVCVTSHTWTEGLFTYAYVTGDREAFRVAVGVCDWILRFMQGKSHLVRQDGREIGWPIVALAAGYRATWDKRYLDAANELVRWYREKVREWGKLVNQEPPGANYTLDPFGEYAGFEGMHKLWRVTGDEELRRFALTCIDLAIDDGHIGFHGHGRYMDVYALYAACDLSGDAPKYLDLAKRLLPLVLGRKDWNGYFYRRIMHYLGLCHRHGWIVDEAVQLNE